MLIRALRSRFTRPDVRIRPARDALAVTVGLLFTALVSLVGLYRSAHHAYTAEIQRTLIRVAEAAASLVDGDTHRAVAQAGREDTPEYAAAVAPLRAILTRVAGARFVYTMTLRDGAPCFVLDATPAGDADGDGVEDHSGILEPYADADPALLTALQEGRPAATPIPEHDRWGTLVSGYAPIFDQAGACVGIVGVDMTADEYYQELGHVRRAALAGILPAIVASLVAGGVTLILRRGALTAEAALEQERQQLLSIFENTDQPVYISDPTTYELLYTNQAFRQTWGDGTGQRCHQVIQGLPAPCSFCTNSRIFGPNAGQPYIWEAQNVRNGRWFRCVDKAIRWPDGRLVRYEMAIEITDRKQAEELLRASATHDALTGLENRTALLAHLARHVKQATDNAAHHFALFFLDFDRFKRINDSLGHAVGDEFLVEIAARLRALAAQRSVGECHAARLGGDEFVVLATGLADAEAAGHFADGLQLVLSRPYHVGGHELTTSVSIGIVLSTATRGAPGELLRDADTAMYRAKSTGRACHVVFDKHMHDEACAALELEKDLGHALARNELSLHYQPIVALSTGRIAGFEALLRWHHARRGAIAPDRFIGVAEETGLIIPLGEWVLRTACAQLTRWQERWGDAAPFLSINLSKKQLMAASFIARLQQIITESGARGPRLKLEVTESVVMGETELMARGLRELKSLGVQLLIDDFGTGHSSLSRLHEFPIDGIKIDRTFVARVSLNRQLAAILHAILTLARNLRKEVIAEGVETCEQLAQLLALNCDLAQGYYFARPLPLADAEALFVTTPPWLPAVPREVESATAALG